MVAQGLDVSAWSPADVSAWLGGLGLNDLKVAVLQNGVSGAQLQYLASTNTLSNIGATPVQASSIITALGMPSNATTGKVPGTNAGGASPKSIPVLVEKSGLDFDSPKLDSLPVDPDAAVVGAGTAAYPGTAAHPTTTQTFNSDGGQDVIIEMGTGSNTILGKGSHTPMSRKFAMALIFFFGCLIVCCASDISILRTIGPPVIDYGATWWVGVMSSLALCAIFIILEAIIGFHGSLKAVRILTITVICAASSLSLITLITAAWRTYDTNHYNYILDGWFKLSLALEWLMFTNWMAVITLTGGQLFLLVKLPKK